MRPTLIALLLSLTAGGLQAHDEIVAIDSLPYGVVSYETPVAYYAPVVYQSAVIYNAPVFYINAIAPQPVCPSVVYELPTPNVIITGGSRAGAYYTSWDTTPNVIIVGRSSQARVTPARCR